jgi:hypothetical protein
MDLEVDREVEIALPKSVLLVLFELLSASYEAWRKDNPDDSSANPLCVVAARNSERVALWRLEGAIERTLPEILSAEYDQLLQAAHRGLT